MTAGLIPSNSEIAAKPLEWDEPYALLAHDAGEDLRGVVFWAHHVVTSSAKEPTMDPRAVQLRTLIAMRRLERKRLREREDDLRVESRRRSDLPSWWLSPSEQRTLMDRCIRQAYA